MAVVLCYVVCQYWVIVCLFRESFFLLRRSLWMAFLCLPMFQGLYLEFLLDFHWKAHFKWKIPIIPSNTKILIPVWFFSIIPITSVTCITRGIRSVLNKSHEFSVIMKCEPGFMENLFIISESWLLFLCWLFSLPWFVLARRLILRQLMIRWLCTDMVFFTEAPQIPINWMHVLVL